MSYVIYNKETTIQYRARARSVGCYKEYWASESAAKAALTRAHRDGKINRDDYAIAEARDFRDNIEKTETVINLMSGKEVKQGVNTPRCCDPSSELYWSM